MNLGKRLFVAAAMLAAIAILGCQGNNDPRPPAPPPEWGVTLDAPATHFFTTAQVGYETVTPLPVTVTNAGNMPTGELAVSVTNAAFTVTGSPIGSIAAEGTATFSVAPNLGLQVDTHTATVTVTGDNNISASFAVSFQVTAEPPPAPTSVSVSPATASVYQGQTQQFSATVAPAAAPQAVTWTIEPAASGTISAAGLLTLSPTATGTVTVRATAAGTTVSGTATVTVTIPVEPPPAPTGVNVTPATATVYQGQTQQFSAAVVPADAPQAVTWSVEPAASGTISAAGLLTLSATATGTVTVRATATGTAVSGTATVTVTIPVEPPPAPTGVNVTPATATVYQGQTQQFSAAVVPATAPQAVTWSVEPAASGTISAAGLLTLSGTATGTVTVRATATGTTVSGTATVTVTIPVEPPPAPTGVNVTPTTATVYQGQTQQFSAAVVPAGTPQAVTWSVEPAASGTISAAGLLTLSPTATGTVTVRATATGTQVSGTATVTVTIPVEPPPAPTGVNVTPATASVYQGQTQQFAATVAPTGAPQAVTWTIEPAAAGTISTTGLLTLSATATGTVTVRATATGTAVSGTATVTVTIPTEPPTQGDGAITITFAEFHAMQTITAEPISLANPGTRTIQVANPGQYDHGSIAWFHMGNPVPAAAVSGEYGDGTFNETLNLNAIHGNLIGTHSVTVEVRRGGALYSQTIRFAVTD